MGRSSSSGLKAKRVSSPGSSQAGASSDALLAEARRLSQQASRKPEGSSRSSVLRRCADLFRNGLALPLSPAEREEALFDLGEVLLQLCASLQAGIGSVNGFFNGTVKKPQAVEAHLQSSVVAAGVCRESAESFEEVCSVKGQLQQEALVNSGVALSDWAEVALEIPQGNGGGVATAKELLGRAHERYSAALQVAPVDVELLVNHADCCVRLAELEFDHPAPSPGYSDSDHWEVVRGLYDQGLNAYTSACANADARIGDDLAGVLHNWGSGLFSAAERCPVLDESFKLTSIGQERFASAIKFRPTDTSVRIGLGECLAGFVDKVICKTSSTQQLLDLLRLACDEGYGSALKIDSANAAALLGLGDAHLAAGKIVADQGLRSQAEKHFEESLNVFNKAFDIIKKDLAKLSTFKYDELCDSLYNFACAAALSGNKIKAIECLEHLRLLDALVVEDAAKDPDLASLEMYFKSEKTSGTSAN